MKTLTFILMVLMACPLYAGGWKGGRAQVPGDTLMCNFLYMDTALTLRSAGDNASIQALIEKGYCVKSKKLIIAVVITDGSTFTDPPLAEIMIDGTSYWVAISDIFCCVE